MDNRNRKHFKFYTKEYSELFKLLSKRQQIILLYCLIDYVEKGILPTRIHKKTMQVFSAIKSIIDGDIEYERIKREQEEADRKLRLERKMAGKKGAKARWGIKNSRISNGKL